MAPRNLQTLSEVFPLYDAVFCDVWGVLHNGLESYPDAVDTLRSAREQGIAVVLITNSPRVSWQVVEQMRSLGVSDDAYDRIVTSGDVTRSLIAAGPRKIYFLGPDLHLPLIDNLEVERVAAGTAEVIVCTGLFDDETEKPGDYVELLASFRERDVQMICANPDIVVERGKRLVPCAGALALEYEAMGGRTLIAGKPHGPIYRAVYAAAVELRRDLAHGRILALGDAIVTDVRGALNFGVDLLYVSEGIHAKEYEGADGRPDEERLFEFLAAHHVSPKWWMERLV
ncbi:MULTISPECIES: TIGR01459 family HAD-type hydrolase [Mesorhizobium]|uniref:HAD-superfamily class IIA hydrolase, TIGR01459 n=1 Tax=Mesorhizobium qingshengii TaxID=1165689 RepID=A0A1G5ZWP3_9HYPH|nr:MULTISPECIES: TIGR01459 family HAD-type hydrolase [Mesorhizobium]AID34973.1 TIGR01459 family HAD-type hydrolase [Mesorhizobium huakuii 7653R]MCH4560636.1 TIGR01459 family HAD-type hydrolase [Mesorhizobium jarvisii]SDA99105.1 HAD-superfamily class IIA hydrolase, TIGR01459 [Mesorhizobium qingshengii]